MPGGIEMGTDSHSMTLAHGATPAPGTSPEDRASDFLQRLHAREISDAEILEHAADCTLLMERAHARFLAHQLPCDRDEAVMWMHRREDALGALSEQANAAREAQIQRAITGGCAK